MILKIITSGDDEDTGDQNDDSGDDFDNKQNSVDEMLEF